MSNLFRLTIYILSSHRLHRKVYQSRVNIANPHASFPVCSNQLHNTFSCCHTNTGPHIRNPSSLKHKPIVFDKEWPLWTQRKNKLDAKQVDRFLTRKLVGNLALGGGQLLVAVWQLIARRRKAATMLSVIVDLYFVSFMCIQTDSHNKLIQKELSISRQIFWYWGWIMFLQFTAKMAGLASFHLRQVNVPGCVTARTDSCW